MPDISGGAEARYAWGAPLPPPLQESQPLQKLAKQTLPLSPPEGSSATEGSSVTVTRRTGSTPSRAAKRAARSARSSAWYRAAREAEESARDLRWIDWTASS